MTHAVQAISPYDELEQEHKEDVLKWVLSDAPIYRVSRPANPPKHLVSYFVVVDLQNNMLLLVDHLKAKLWLPTGGHVEMHEDPVTTVVREAEEELGIQANFIPPISSRPFFITSTLTKGVEQHTDVSLWYLIGGNMTDTIPVRRQRV